MQVPAFIKRQVFLKVWPGVNFVLSGIVWSIVALLYPTRRQGMGVLVGVGTGVLVAMGVFVAVGIGVSVGMLGVGEASSATRVNSAAYSLCSLGKSCIGRCGCCYWPSRQVATDQEHDEQ